MRKLNVWIPGSGWGTGARIELSDIYPIINPNRNEYKPLVFNEEEFCSYGNLIYNIKDMVVQPRDSTKVIGYIKEFVEIPYKNPFK